MMRTVRRCTYPGCTWEYEEPSPGPLMALPGPAPANPQDYLSKAVDQAMVRHSEVVESKIRDHLDADHPGWTMEELEQLFRQQAQPPNPAAIIQGALERRIDEDNLAGMPVEEVSQATNAEVIVQALKAAGWTIVPSDSDEW